MLKRIIPAVVAILLASCATTPHVENGKALVIGTDNTKQKVMIRTIDNGDILWVGGYQLGTKASVMPGEHKINIMCQFIEPWGSSILPGNDVVLNAEAGRIYELTGTATTDGKKCDITVKPRV